MPTTVIAIVVAENIMKLNSIEAVIGFGKLKSILRLSARVIELISNNLFDSLICFLFLRLYPSPKFKSYLFEIKSRAEKNKREKPSVAITVNSILALLRYSIFIKPLELSIRNKRGILISPI